MRVRLAAGDGRLAGGRRLQMLSWQRLGMCSLLPMMDSAVRELVPGCGADQVRELPRLCIVGWK